MEYVRASAQTPGRLEIGLVLAILLALSALLVYQAKHVGVTIDEPAHVLSSYLYWGGADRLRPSDMPPLIKIVGGWVPRLEGLPVPADLGRKGDNRHEWQASLLMMTQMSRQQIQDVFFHSRLPLIIFPLFTAVLLWWWGRLLFGPFTAALLLLAFALEPTALAHGAIFKNDLAATFAYLLLWFCAWRFWNDPRPWRAALLGAAALLAALSKLSMLVFLGFAPLLVVLAYRLRVLTNYRRMLVILLLVVVIPYVGLLAAYQFDASVVKSREIAALERDPNFSRLLLTVCPVFQLLPVPEGLWRGGLALTSIRAADSHVYMLGHTHAGGTPEYFPFALAMKVPLPLQILVIAGAVLIAINCARRKFKLADVFWLLPGFLYIGMASFYPSQLGIRLILPALPFGLLLAGMAISNLESGNRKFVAGFLLAWLAFVSLRAYPHGIAYFNAWAGAPENHFRYLTDSNLDWGQGLPELSAYIRDSEIKKINVAYFGTNHMFAYVSDNTVQPMITPYSPEYITSNPFKPAPGMYAISASYLTGHMFVPKFRDYFKTFREMKPEACIADSIFVFRVEPNAVSLAGTKQLQSR